MSVNNVIGDAFIFYEPVVFCFWLLLLDVFVRCHTNKWGLSNQDWARVLRFKTLVWTQEAMA